MAKGTTQSRKNRRAQFRAMGYLRIKNMFGAFSEQSSAWYNKMQEDGTNAHSDFIKKNLERFEDKLQTKANSMKETWALLGYTESEINILEEAFFTLSVRYKGTLRSDVNGARKMMKEVSNALIARKNANG
jgi:hypothetical protein